MRILSFWQPWASLVAHGVKTIETRSWSTSYRGPLAIHAAKRPMDADGRRLNFEALGHLGDWRTHYGAIVAVADLVDVLPMVRFLSRYPGDEPNPSSAPAEWTLPIIRINSDTSDASIHRSGVPVADIAAQLPYGHFEAGRFGWLLDNVRRLETPIAWRGSQGLRIAPPHLVDHINAWSKPTGAPS